MEKFKEVMFNLFWYLIVGTTGILLSGGIGVGLCLSLILFPFGVQAFRFLPLLIHPKGKEVQLHFTKQPVLNILWWLLGGVLVVAVYYLLAGVLFITIVGIPLAKQLLTIAKFNLAPFGADVYQDGVLIERENINTEISENRSLNKPWKELLYAASGLGPNLLMVLMMAYFTDAINPKGLDIDGALWCFNPDKLPIIIVGAWGILWTIGRIFDGLIDIPLAHVTDNMKSKLGRHRTPILISFLPMVVSFVLCWVPIGSQLANTIWIMFWSLVFFATYTMCLITFYGSLSTVCTTQKQRTRVSSYKSVFDTIGYCLVYAAIPAIMKLASVSVVKMALYLSPLMITMLIPLFMVKEGNMHETEEELNKEEKAKVGFWDSLKITFTSKVFLKWLVVNCCAFFGLQMFLVSQNALISGVMKLGAGQAAIMNTCAFAPVPLMIWLFNKIKNKVGLRTAYQTCLIAFAIGILSFVLGSEFVFPGKENETIRIIIGCVGAVFSSWSIGIFFMMPYLIPTQIAAVETEVTGKNHSAMYFAAQAVVTSVVGAVASGLVYEYLKNWTGERTYDGITSPDGAKYGVLLVPIITAAFCLLGFFLCYLMPKNFTKGEVAAELVKNTEDNKTQFTNGQAE